MTHKLGSTDVIHTLSAKVGRPDDYYQGFKRETRLLKRGHQKTPTSRPFTSETVFDRDIEIPLRDGIRLRADVFRPNLDEKTPALICWSPYGKGGSGAFNLRIAPGRSGIPESVLSGYEKWEAPDPAEWVPRGYAVVNIDSRGTFDSEGDIRFFGSAEGRDGYDAVEFIGQLPWCSGSVALVGNSWLAMVQYFIAAEQPPHLKCIAPLEGCSDLYRESLCRGGIPYTPFWATLTRGLSGHNQTEDVVAMLDKYPLANEYWDDKRASMDKIAVPAYILASYSTALHTEGSFRCFEEMKAPRWLVVHSTQEWHDLYTNERTDDLNKFFDRFLKGIENNWESTPLVRGCLLGFNQEPITNLPLADWPPPNTQYKRLFLSECGKLSEQLTISHGQASYQSDIAALQMDNDSGELRFTWTFQEKSYMLGCPRASIYVSSKDHDDLDVFIQLRKADKSGNILQNVHVPLSELGVRSQDEVPTLTISKYLGPPGMVRASRRETSPEISQPHYQRLSLRKENKVTPGAIVKLDIPTWPSGIIFEPNEQLILKISGHPMVPAEFPQLRGSYIPENKGQHIVYFGGEQVSYVDIPFVNL